MMNQVSTVERPRRREYSADFKTEVLEQSRQSGASVAGVAISHGLNPNMVHRWAREARQGQMLAQLHEAGAFVRLQAPTMPESGLAVEARADESKTSAPAAPSEEIRIEIDRAGARVRVRWPISAAAQCAQLLREWLR